MPPDLISNPAIGIGAAILIGLAVFLAMAALRALLGVLWRSLPEARRDKAEEVLRFVFGRQVAPVDALSLLLFIDCALAVVLTLAGLRPPAVGILILVLMVVPVLLYFRASGRHAKELELALPLALQQVANEMAAGATPEIALRKVEKSVPAPADVEIARLRRRVEVNGIDAAFAEMAKDLDSPSFTLTASVVRVGTSSGGRMIEALKNLSRTLIEIERLNKKIRTASENGRRNLYLMSLIGPVVAFASAFVVHHETTVLEDPFGQLLIGISLIAFIAAHVIGHVMTRVKV